METSMEFVLYEKKDHIATITVNRPQVFNAYSLQVLSELMEALDTADKDTDVRCVIYTAVGEKAFSAGGDIKYENTMNGKQAYEFSKLGQGLTRKVYSLRCPVIIAARGYCLGAGMEVMLTADYIIVAKGASIGLPTIKLGYVSGFGGSVMLPQLIGHRATKKLLMTGKSLTAEEALELGIVDEVVEPEDLLPAAQKYAEEIASKAPLAIEKTKKIVNFALASHLEDAFELESQMFGSCFDTEDRLNAATAFIEHRKPDPFYRR